MIKRRQRRKRWSGFVAYGQARVASRMGLSRNLTKLAAKMAYSHLEVMETRALMQRTYRKRA